MNATQLPHDAAAAHTAIIRDVLKVGMQVGEVGEKGSSREILGYTTGMSNPLARVSVSEGSALNVVAAVARFVWMVSGSDRVADIAYYEPRVRSYTDDGLAVPGSSYGKRIFNASPGTNQMTGVVKELKANSDSRRAAAVVWLPEDAVRKSGDIPCTFGLFFHIREGGLTMTTVMRSNNAVTLVPYNFFEFSMLGELVASEIGVPFVRYVHWAASMHIYDNMTERAGAIAGQASPRAITMPPMPAGNAMEQGRMLAIHEAALRHANTLDELRDVAAAAHEELDEYWTALFDVLHAYGLAKRQHREEAKDVLEGLPDYFAQGAAGSVLKALKPDEPVLSGSDNALFDLDDITALNTPGSAASVATVVRAADVDDVLEMLETLSSEIDPVTITEANAVRRIIAEDGYALAARGSNAAPRVEIDQVSAALEKLRRRPS
ncbi:hypothetical protein ASF79_15855 [Agreia sp. Leaf335]|uniref:thymidylate synthase n=1 Tax=Agreia sp. Leaf335 TaxID=1736340 RepID=UPI0006F9737A|nr:thymidylate synthase [Agreia sp. Leaf335]KQR19143.1 hypothetical protein ASF79_15855 [Agreia sp. Leaf335]